VTNQNQQSFGGERSWSGWLPSFPAGESGYWGNMEWSLDDPTGTLEVTFNRTSAPSRDEVGAFLEQVKPIVGRSAIRTLLVNGERVNGRGLLTYPEIATPVLYAAARQRTVGVPTRS